MALDRVPYLPDVPFGPSAAGLPLVNWVLDAIEWGAVAWLIWPKGGEAGSDVIAVVGQAGAANAG